MLPKLDFNPVELDQSINQSNTINEWIKMSERLIESFILNSDQGNFL